MRFIVTMKCPDALEQAIIEAAELKVGGPPNGVAADMAYLDAITEARKAAQRWFKHDEYLSVTVDTEAETCVVNPA